MARTKAEYQAEGMSDASTSPSNKKSHLYYADSWQGKAYKSGYDAVAHPTTAQHVKAPTAYAVNPEALDKPLDCPACAAGVPLRGAGKTAAVDNAAFVCKAPKAPTGVKTGPGLITLDGREIGTVKSLYLVPEDSPAALRRHARIASMCRGYLRAMAWSSGDTHPKTGEELEDLEDFEVSEAATLKANEICEAFYDANMTDLGAYADLRSVDVGQCSTNDRQLGAYEYAGHDLWLTTAGHGVGFWDRGMGRVGKRLADQCGHGKPFPGRDAYLGDDLEIHLS